MDKAWPWAQGFVQRLEYSGNQATSPVPSLASLEEEKVKEGGEACLGSTLGRSGLRFQPGRNVLKCFVRLHFLPEFNLPDKHLGFKAELRKCVHALLDRGEETAGA